MNRSFGFILFLILATVIGCGKDKTKFANVKGKVTYNGSPIEKGFITFSIEGQPPSSMKIVDGEFNGQAMVGSNKVSVSARKKVAAVPKAKGGAVAAKDADTQMKGYMKFKAGKGEFGGPPLDYDPTLVEYIPAEWNTQSKQMRVVEAGAPNEFDFDIKGPN